MQHIWEFWVGIFWVSLFAFMLNQYNFFKLLIIAELSWSIIYVLAILCGLDVGNICLISLGFFILVFAAFEFVLGIMLVTFIKDLSGSFKGDSSITTSNNQQTYRLKKYFFNNIKF